MPILAEETAVYPETLLEYPPMDIYERHWWVLYTKARQEKALSRDLLAHEVPFYLPLVRKPQVIRGRSMVSHLPLFSGYVFLYGSHDERLRSLMTNRVSRTLSVGDPERLVYDLRQLQRLIESNAPLTVESRMVPGDRVRVRRGPLAGIEGTVLGRRGATRLMVSVDFLQQGASVQIDDFLLEPVD